MALLEWMLDYICGSDLFNDVYGILNKNLFTEAATSVASAIYNTVKPVAIMLMFIYFMIAVVDKLSSENFTWEQLWRQMALLLASYYLIIHLFEILNILSNIGLSILTSIGNPTTKDVVVNSEDLIQTFRESMGLDDSFFSFLADIVMILYLILPLILAWIMRICVCIVCYSRMGEILVRVAFSPIAISDFFQSGLQGGGWRWLKNFLAVSLQGAFILAISAIFSSLMESFVVTDANLFNFMGKYLAFYASAVMLMFKSLSLAKEVVGTG